MRVTWFLTCAVWAAACGDDTSGGADPAVLIRTDPAGAQCPHGGTVISSGADLNGNALLDDSEVQTRTPLCNAAAGATLTRLAAEPAGEHCPSGGTAVETGLDADGDGVLDDNEVAHVDYVCGEVLLTRLSPAGARCAAGGVAIEIGRDFDHDGTLSDAEVEHTELSCGEVLNHSVVVTVPQQAAALADIVLINGDVSLAGAGTVTLPKLQIVTGGFEVIQGAEVAAPALATVGGTLRISSPGELAPRLPALTAVGGDLQVASNGALSALALPALTSVAGDFEVEANRALQSIATAAVRVGGRVAVNMNSRLASLDMHLSAAPREIEVTLDGLTSLELVIGEGGAPAPVIQVASNAALADVELTGRHLGRVSLSGPALAQVAVRADDVEDLVLQGDVLDRLALTGPPGARLRILRGLSLHAPVSSITGTVDVAGVCALVGTRLTSLGNVGRVNFLLASDNTELTEIRNVSAQAFSISRNPRLSTIELGLVDVNGSARIDGNPALTRIALPDAARAVDLVIANNAVLDTLELPALAAVRTLQIVDNAKLPACAVAAVFAHVTGALEQRGNDTAASCEP